MKKLPNKTAVLIASGVYGDSKPEELLNQAIIENSLDLLDLALEAHRVDFTVILTNSRELAVRSTDLCSDVEIERTSDDFHFGETLYRIIENHNISNLLYFGGGTGLLLTLKHIEKLLDTLSDSDKVSISNNFYSTDFFGISPAEELLASTPPQKDNLLGWKSREVGFKPAELERNFLTQIDVDTPIDLIPIKEYGTPHPRLSSYLSSLDLDNSRFKEIAAQLTDPSKRLVIAGRVGASTWSHLEKNVACHVDVFSEGRGSYAFRAEDESTPSLLGNLFSSIGPEALLDILLSRGSCLLLDTRVILNYYGRWPSRQERFWSDLLQPDKLQTSFLRELTRAARDSGKPVIIGGHSLVSGGLYLMVENSWNLDNPTSNNIRPVTISI